MQNNRKNKNRKTNSVENLQKEHIVEDIQKEAICEDILEMSFVDALEIDTM